MTLFKYSTNAKEKYPSYQDFDKAKYLAKEIYTSGDKMKAIKTKFFAPNSECVDWNICKWIILIKSLVNALFKDLIHYI